MSYLPSQWVTGATNIGAGSGVYSGVLPISLLQLKTLIGGSGIRISGNSANDTLTLLVTGIVGGGGVGGYDVYTARYFV